MAWLDAVHEVVAALEDLGEDIDFFFQVIALLENSVVISLHRSPVVKILLLPDLSSIQLPLRFRPIRPQPLLRGLQLQLQPLHLLVTCSVLVLHLLIHIFQHALQRFPNLLSLDSLPHQTLDSAVGGAQFLPQPLVRLRGRLKLPFLAVVVLDEQLPRPLPLRRGFALADGLVVELS